MSVTISGSGQIIKQIVAATYSTQTATSSGTYSSTGLTATITPTNAANKILVIANVPVNPSQLSAADYGGTCAIYRNGSSVWQDTNTYDSCYIGPYANYIANVRQRTDFMYLDSPATTSATTYTIYIASYNGTCTICSNGAKASILLMEVAYA